MAKYHYNSETGKSGVCRAAEGNCPLKGDVRHFPTINEANSYAEKIESENNTLFTNISKSKGREAQRVRPNPEDYGFPKDYFENIARGYADKLRNRQGNLEDDDSNKNLPYIYHKKWDSWIDWQRKNPGLALEPMPNAPKKVKIYRSGAMDPAKYEGEIAMYADEADYHRPAAPRHGSLFASADGRGLNRWLKANGDPMAKRDVKDFEPIEIEVDPNKVRVYHIPSWEDVSWRGAPPQKFWDSGMLLSRFNEACAEEGWDSSEWEVLVDPKDVIKSKPMSSASVTRLTSDYIHYDGDREELKKTLKEVARWRRENKVL